MPAAYFSLMNDPDLSKLLRQWPDLEPQPAFAADVRRRLRQAAPPAEPRWAWLAPLAAAAVVALMVSIGTARRAAEPVPVPITFLAPDTLAGGYLRLAEGRR